MAKHLSARAGVISPPRALAGSVAATHARPIAATNNGSDAWVRLDPHDPRLQERVAGLDQDGNRFEARVVVERPLTMSLNSQSIFTVMTVGDWPNCLAASYLLFSVMLMQGGRVPAIDRDEGSQTEVVRTLR